MVRVPLKVCRTLAAVAALAFLASACGGSDYRYIESPSNGMYFKIPDDWRLSGGSGVDFVAQPGLLADYRYYAVVDAAPENVPDNTLVGPYPYGMVRIRNLTSKQRADFSLRELRNEYLTFDDLYEQEKPRGLTLLTQQDIVKPDGTRGSRFVYTVHLDGTSFTVDQTALVDPATTKVYFFILGCEARCFDANRKVITEVADSWTIKERS